MGTSIETHRGITLAAKRYGLNRRQMADAMLRLWVTATEKDRRAALVPAAKNGNGIDVNNKEG